MVEEVQILDTNTKEILETYDISQEDIPELKRKIKILKSNNTVVEEEFNRFDIMILD